MVIVELDAMQAHAKLTGLVELLQDGVDGGASIGFWRPLSAEIANDYWLKIFDDVKKGNRILLIALVDERVVGTAQLELATKTNSPHRAEVQKLMVHTEFRGQGLGRKMLEALDTAALRAGRTLLVLDTKKGDVAEGLYRRYGYIEVGEIPRYVQDENGIFDATVIFYRELNSKAD